MTSRELVRQTLEFRSPTRVPRDLWLLDWANNHYPHEVESICKRYPSDFTSAPGFLRATPHTVGHAQRIGQYTDEWGCTFENLQNGVIGEVKEPVLKDLSQVEQLRTPNELLSVDLEQVNAYCRSTDRFVMGGCCPRPFERAQFLRTSESFYLDLAERPEEARRLLKKLHEFNLKEMEVWSRSEVDALNFMDDWGAQRALLISPRMWRELFKPLYQDYINLAHASGKYIFMHSDGFIEPILPDLVEMGLDAINSQLFCMNIEAIGKKFAGKITFWGEIDRQHLLPYGMVNDISSAVERVSAALCRHGGVIAQCEFGAGAQPENVERVFSAWNEIHPDA